MMPLSDHPAPNHPAPMRVQSPQRNGTDVHAIPCKRCAEAPAIKPAERPTVEQRAVEQPAVEQPIVEQPREKLLLRGAASLSDVELLAVWLGTGTRGIPVQVLASSLLAHVGGLAALLQTSQQLFCALPGLGDARYTQWAAVVELCRRAVYESLEKGDVLSSPAQVREYLSLQMSGLQHEVFAALFLDNRHRVIKYQVLFKGTIDGAAVYPREVVKSCLSLNAAAIIFAHNHPSGMAEPSDADITISRKLKEALALVDVHVLDHLIVGEGVQTSMAERGLL